MINLLPPESKKQIRAARTNVLLARYNLLIAAAIVFLGLALGFVYIFLMNSKASAEATIQENTQKESTYSDVKNKADAFRAQLGDAKTIFDEQISYSRAALNLASLFPEGTAIDKLELDANSFTTPMTFNVKVKGEQEARNLLNNLQSSPFVTNVSQGGIAIITGDYNYTLEITLTLTKEAAL